MDKSGGPGKDLLTGVYWTELKMLLQGIIKINYPTIAKGMETELTRGQSYSTFYGLNL